MAARQKKFLLVLIKPSHYDDDGYVIQWLRSAIPSNTLAVLNGLALDCAERKVLGEDVAIEITAYDETNTRIRPERIARIIARADGGMVALVGVQSNQFPHAMDLARRLRVRGAPVCIGGFHVSGTIAMLPGIQPELAEAQRLGISLFAGEAEGRLEEVLRDAWQGTLKPLYNYMDDLPGLEGVPPPMLPATRVKRTAGGISSFDAGRGCPFQCSFCTIINVQGRKSRYRSADDIEQLIRRNVAQGVNRFFITDDNFARNKDWEKIFDRLIALREGEGMDIKFIIQVDTLCHRNPNFISKAVRAGVARVFLGLESINPDSLAGAKKRQNKITEYREMMLEWKRGKVTTYAGYILGFPTDTVESIVRDIEIIKRELPIDLLEFFCLTPLPGSEDHKNLFLKGAPLDPDLNKYDLEHVTTTHAKMSPEEWARAYRLAWETFYSPEHMATVMRRAAATGISAGKTLFLLLWFYGCITIEKIHPLEGGYFRRKYRRDRRPTLPRESVLAFYRRYAAEIIAKHWRMGRLIWQMTKVRKQIKRDPHARDYMDEALTPVIADELETSQNVHRQRRRQGRGPQSAARRESAQPRQRVMPQNPVHVIGGGLAGSEAAWQVARAGIPVVLHEMRPVRGTEAHQTAGLAELVCSNSLRSDDAENNAVGLLHEEMRRCGSLVLRAADATKLPAGGALAVDRDHFSAQIETALGTDSLIEIRREEIATLPPEDWHSVILATGPLTSPDLAAAISALTGEQSLAFFDAIAPIVHADSIDLTKAWRQSRYDKGDGADYLNCALEREPYRDFVAALLASDTVAFHDWEKDTPYFDGCLPVEVMAARGVDTLRFGPMKPVGLTDPSTGRRPYAVVQLRQDNALGTLYNLVGFQTKLRHADQVRIFRTIPGLERAEFARLGGLHRNTFINSPKLLDGSLRLKALPRLRFAGQITGVEGYVESAAIGLLAGRFAAAEILGTAQTPPPATTALGALLGHITGGGDAKSFQPMNVNFGLFPPLPDGTLTRANRGEKKPLISRRALADLASWLGPDRAAAE